MEVLGSRIKCILTSTETYQRLYTHLHPTTGCLLMIWIKMRYCEHVSLASTPNNLESHGLLFSYSTELSHFPALDGDCTDSTRPKSWGIADVWSHAKMIPDTCPRMPLVLLGGSPQISLLLKKILSFTKKTSFCPIYTWHRYVLYVCPSGSESESESGHRRRSKKSRAFLFCRAWLQAEVL